MTIKAAIEKAVTGDWFDISIHRVLRNSRDRYIFTVLDEDEKEVNKFIMSLQEILALPAFWQSLGKALGWGKELLGEGYCGKCYEGASQMNHDCERWQVGTHEASYLYYWHRFIDHLAENKSIESFFELLEPKEQK